MTSLKVDVEAERKKLMSLQIRLPERIRRLHDKIREAGEECAHQRTLVRWYSWVTEVIEALGPDWRLIGDSTDIVTDDETEGPEIFGEVELNLGGDTEGVGGFSLELSQEPGNVCLRWTDPVVKNQEMDLVLFVETAAHVASVINEKIAEVRASAKEQA